MSSTRLPGKILAEIAGELGDLPLALRLANRYLNFHAGIALGTPKIYLDDLRQQAKAPNHPAIVVARRLGLGAFPVDWRAVGDGGGNPEHEVALTCHC